MGGGVQTVKEKQKVEREEQEVKKKIICPGLAGIPLCSFLWISDQPLCVCVCMDVHVSCRPFLGSRCGGSVSPCCRLTAGS